MMYFQYGETEINYLKRKDKKLAWAIEQIGRIERKLDANLFAAVVRHIVGQQISSKAQATVWARLEARLKVVTPFTVYAASAQELQALGMSLRKAEYIKDFADKIVSGDFDLQAVEQMSDAEAITALSSLKGIGKWTAEMILLFCQRRKVKDFFIKFKKKSHFADFLTEQTLDFVLHRLFCGLAEMDTDDIGCLADLLSDSRASGGVSCGIVHSKSSCK